MVTYDTVKHVFGVKGCELLETEEEFNQTNMSTTQKYRYRASCGHEHQVWLNVFKNRGTGVMCPNCVIKASVQRTKDKFKDNKLLFLDMEKTSIQYIQSLLEKEFDFKRTCEGCLADVAVKPKTVKTNDWLQIQVKSTSKPNPCYNFHCNQSYLNCVVICLCHSDKKIWLFNGNEIKVTKKLAIGLKKSRHDNNQVTHDCIAQRLRDMYKSCVKMTFESLNIPIAYGQKTEREFAIFREHMFPHIRFEYPVRQGLHFDFTVNGRTVQEKVGSAHRSGFTFIIGKNKTRKEKHSSYDVGDCDFYWLHLGDKIHFFCIPETVMIEKGFVGEHVSTRLYINLNSKKKCKHDWIKDYLYQYNDVAISERLSNVFGLTAQDLNLRSIKTKKK